MKRLLVVFLLIFSIIACNKNSGIVNSNNSEWKFLKYDAKRCPDEIPPDLAKEQDFVGNPNYLNFWKYQNDTLLLDFYFEVTCFSAFEDSIALESEKISIFLDDTSSVHARCLCNYECQFRFLIPQLEQFQLQLNIKFFGSENYESCLDTLIVISP